MLTDEELFFESTKGAFKFSLKQVIKEWRCRMSGHDLDEEQLMPIEGQLCARCGLHGVEAYQHNLSMQSKHDEEEYEVLTRPRLSILGVPQQ